MTNVVVQLDRGGRNSSIEVGGVRLERVTAIAISQRVGDHPRASFDVLADGAVIVTAPEAEVAGVVRVPVLGQLLEVPFAVCACRRPFVAVDRRIRTCPVCRREGARKGRGKR